MTAWQQVVGLASAEVAVRVMAGSIERNLGDDVNTHATLEPMGLKIPFRLLGLKRVNAIHDFRVASWISANHSKIDIVHGWPSASLRSIRAAKQFGIPFVLERPNAHTAFAYEEVAEECRRVGVDLPKNHDHSWNAALLEHEEEEYALADYLLCPSEFVKATFLDRGFESSKLLRHRYGYDSAKFSVGPERFGRQLTMVYAGVCDPRKGLHYALEAWVRSDASRTGRFRICGEFVPGYRAILAKLLAHPSVEVMGQRDDLAEILKEADLFVLPSIEEGSALVTYEARAGGCVLLVSDRTGAVCEHQVDSLVHPARDVAMLSAHISLLDSEPETLARLRSRSLATVSDLTWNSAGRVLSDCYRKALTGRFSEKNGC